MIRIERPSRWADCVRKYKIVLDGREVGRIGNGQTVELDAGPGPHELRLAIDWCGSPSIAFEVSPANAQGEPIVFECAPAIAGWRSIVALLYITVLCSRYIRLERVA
ncbi:MAG: hypothetical protein ACIAQU_07920 [Phycisphaerales bacterium JB064]